MPRIRAPGRAQVAGGSVLPNALRCRAGTTSHRLKLERCLLQNLNDVIDGGLDEELIAVGHVQQGDVADGLRLLRCPRATNLMEVDGCGGEREGRKVDNEEQLAP
jgi:hypothetical protein